MHSEDQLKSLIDRVTQLEQRNSLAELDKAWETSRTRRLAIVLLAYGLMVVALFIIGTDHPWTHAIIPTLGFAISTLTLRYFKHLWVTRIRRRSVIESTSIQ